MKYGEFKNNLIEIYNKVFRKSKVQVVANNNLYKCIYINCYLANDKTELANGYAENDMFHIWFEIDTENGEFKEKITDDMELPENLVLSNNSNMIKIIPENKFMVYSNDKVAFRKTKGNAEKILKSFEKYVIGLYNKVCELENNGMIHDNYKELVNKKLH